MSQLFKMFYETKLNRLWKPFIFISFSIQKLEIKTKENVPVLLKKLHLIQHLCKFQLWILCAQHMLVILMIMKKYQVQIMQKI